MNKYLKITLLIIGTILLLQIIDLICIFTINRPLFSIKEDNDDSINIVYKGILYNTYNCLEYSSPQIKGKGSKFKCATERIDIGKVIEIVDTTKEMKNFKCRKQKQIFYEDNNYEYYYNCKKNKYVIVRYESGFEEPLSEALKNQTIRIKEIELANIEFEKQEKTNKKQS